MSGGITPNTGAGSTISCVVPVRNGERFLGEALQCIVTQTRPPAEVLVVIDGGTDRSAEVAQAFGDPVRVLHTPGLGPAGARNLGIAAAVCDLIALFDCDDLYLPHRLERQAGLIEWSGADALCLCGVENFWMPEVAEERDWAVNTRFTGKLPGYCGGSLMFSRAVIGKIGPLNAAFRFTDIVDWIMRARNAGVPVLMEDEVLVRRRRHLANLSRVGAEDGREEFLALIAGHLRERRAVNPTG